MIFINIQTKKQKTNQNNIPSYKQTDKQDNSQFPVKAEDNTGEKGGRSIDSYTEYPGDYQETEIPFDESIEEELVIDDLDDLE